MDWTLEDNDKPQRGRTPLVQAGAETSDTGAEAVEPDPRCQWLSQEFVQGDQSPDVSPIVPFAFFKTIENWHEAPAKIFLFQICFGGGYGLYGLPGGCFGDESTESRSASQLFCISPHFCYCRTDELLSSG